MCVPSILCLGRLLLDVRFSYSDGLSFEAACLIKVAVRYF